MYDDTYPPAGPGEISERSRGVALALALLLGVFGGHRFYAGKQGTAILMLLTMGGLGLWTLYDVVLIASGAFRDGGGRLVVRWETEGQMAGSLMAHGALAELEALRAEVAELQERVDFTERLLAAPDRPRPRFSSEITPV